MEFCTEKELVAQTGHQSYEWLRVIAKELVDNGIDACEDAEIAPVIKVAITTGQPGMPTRISVEDNGPGIPPDTVTGIIDYDVRVSSREAYISPTRGRQGNALKTILPMSYVVGGKVTSETWIEAHGIGHRLIFSVNQIKQEPIVKNNRCRSRVKTGTRITDILAGHRRPFDRRRRDQRPARPIHLGQSAPDAAIRRRRQDRAPLRREQPGLDKIQGLRCDLGALVHAGAIRTLCRRVDRPRSRAQERPREHYGQRVCRPIQGHERDRKAEGRSARTRRVAHVAVPVLWLRNQSQSSADGEAAALVAAAHAAGAPGIARRGRRGALAAIV